MWCSPLFWSQGYIFILPRETSHSTANSGSWAQNLRYGTIIPILSGQEWSKTFSQDIYWTEKQKRKSKNYSGQMEQKIAVAPYLIG